MPQSELFVSKSTQRSGPRQYESPWVGQAHVPPEHTVPGFNAQSAAWRHSTQVFLGTSQMGVGVRQSVFDTQPLGLLPPPPELDEDEPPPVPPIPLLLELLLDELDAVGSTSGSSMMS